MVHEHLILIQYFFFLSERGEAAVLRWFGHVERMEGERLVKKIYRAEAEGNRRRGRPRRRWMDGVKGCLSERGLSIPEAEECVKDRREWRRIVGGRRR